MGYYFYFTIAMFPTAAALLLFIMMPVWGKMRSLVLRIVDAVLFMELGLFGLSVTLYKFLLLLSVITCALSTLDMWKAQAQFAEVKVGHVQNEYAVLRKFRTERNWWLSLFSLSLWLILWRVRAYIHKIASLEAELGPEPVARKPVATKAAQAGETQLPRLEPKASPNVSAGDLPGEAVDLRAKVLSPLGGEGVRLRKPNAIEPLPVPSAPLVDDVAVAPKKIQ